MERKLETISKLYKYKPIRPYKGLLGSIPVKHKDVFVGVEVELEGVDSPVFSNTCIEAHTDHSLKVAGVEFVTIPVQLKYLEVELQRLFSNFKKKPPLISSRCSTHVHVNVRDMTTEQIINMVLLYMVFERSLFRISGDRHLSNFCVPLYSSHSMVESLFKNRNVYNYWKWYKYSALNISPIWGGESSTIGTVEFRHMHGSTDVEEIVNWCNIITSLKRAAQDFEQEEIIAHIRTMNTTSGYYWLAKEVFGRSSKRITRLPTFKEDTEDCITNLKHLMVSSFFSKEEKKEESKKPKGTITMTTPTYDNGSFFYTLPYTSDQEVTEVTVAELSQAISWHWPDLLNLPSVWELDNIKALCKMPIISNGGAMYTPAQLVAKWKEATDAVVPASPVEINF